MDAPRSTDSMALGSGGGFLAGMAVVTFFIPHYVAVITGIIIALVLQGMRHLRTWRPEGRPIGMALMRALVVVSVFLVPLHAWLWDAQRPGKPRNHRPRASPAF